MLDIISTTSAPGDKLPDMLDFPPTENSNGTVASNLGHPASIEDIKAACAECAAYNGGEGFFGREWDGRVERLLKPAYTGLVLVADDPDRLAIAVRHSKVETTKATLKNPALIFVKMTARPNDKAQMKLCSGWAEILNEARAENVSVEGFVAWVKERNERRQRPGMANKRLEPNGAQDLNQLKLRLTGPDGCIHEILVLTPAVHVALTEALKAPGPRSERVQQVANSLHAFADELKAKEASMNGSDAGPAVADVTQT